MPPARNGRRSQGPCSSRTEESPHMYCASRTRGPEPSGGPPCRGWPISIRHAATSKALTPMIFLLDTDRPGGSPDGIPAGADVGYAVETVEDCVAETQTGFQRRRPSTGSINLLILARRHACSPTQPSRSLRPGCGWQDDGRALRAQFYRESRNETLPGHPRALHAVDSVAPVLAIGGPCGVQDDVAITGASQGIRFDPPDSLSILEVHAQAVGGRKADDFQV